jgi:hypothetical protein
MVVMTTSFDPAIGTTEPERMEARVRIEHLELLKNKASY